MLYKQYIAEAQHFIQQKYGIQLILVCKAESAALAQGMMKVIAYTLDVPLAYIMEYNREREVADARIIAMVLIKKTCGLTTVKTGEIFNRDHSTVINAQKVFNNMMFIEDVDFVWKVQRCEQALIKYKIQNNVQNNI